MGKMIARLCKDAGDLVTDFDSADVCIDFSHPDALFKHLQKAAGHKKPLVIGTTGWESQKVEVLRFVKEHEMGVVASPNFSLGIHLLLSILKEAAQCMKPFEEYEIAGIEVHHSQKIDAPSGTAIAISNVIDDSIGKKCSFSSVRVGSIPGTHTVLFDSPCDTISITHTARNREGFAKGALLAASWICGKKGFYTFEECLRRGKDET